MIDAPMSLPSDQDAIAAEPPPLRSVHTSNFPALLEQLGASLLVTTYQAGKLVVIRSDGDHINTHFRNFQSPMGLAVAGDRLAIGTTLEIWEFHNVPAVAAKREPVGKVDACFLPRGSHTTGNVQIHEMAWGGGDELWFVNTRFSCLCTRAPVHSFVPRWKPPFITKLAPDDRCHLNGMALVDGAPRFVTRTETPTSRTAGGPTRRTAACCSTCRPVKRSPLAYRCRTRRAGMRGGSGCWNRATARLDILIRARTVTSAWPSFPASRADWISSARSRSWDSPRCANRRFSAGFRSPTACPSAVAASGSSTRATAVRSHSQI